MYLIAKDNRSASMILAEEEEAARQAAAQNGFLKQIGASKSAEVLEEKAGTWAREMQRKANERAEKAKIAAEEAGRRLPLDPAILNSCHTYDESSEFVKIYFPKSYTTP